LATKKADSFTVFSILALYQIYKVKLTERACLAPEKSPI
jgi:hypothetical protein